MFNPIVLRPTIRIVPRADLLFCHCGMCERPVCWQPVGGAVFASNCCNRVYNAVPMGLDCKFFEIAQEELNMKNVRLMRRKKQ